MDSVDSIPEKLKRGESVTEEEVLRYLFGPTREELGKEKTKPTVPEYSPKNYEGDILAGI
jgi:hypothetical protein